MLNLSDDPGNNLHHNIVFILNQDMLPAGKAELIMELIEEAGYLKVEEAQLEVLPDEEIGDCLDLEIEKTYPRKDGSFVSTVDCDKVSQATNDYNEAKGKLYRRIE